MTRWSYRWRRPSPLVLGTVYYARDIAGNELKFVGHPRPNRQYHHERERLQCPGYPELRQRWASATTAAPATTSTCGRCSRAVAVFVLGGGRPGSSTSSKSRYAPDADNKVLDHGIAALGAGRYCRQLNQPGSPFQGHGFTANMPLSFTAPRLRTRCVLRPPITLGRSSRTHSRCQQRRAAAPST